MKRVALLFLLLGGCGFPPVFGGEQGKGDPGPQPVVSTPVASRGSGGSSSLPYYYNFLGETCGGVTGSCGFSQYCNTDWGDPFCACIEGTGGPSCQFLDSCSEVDCGETGNCLDFGQGPRCVCLPGYEGEYPSCVDLDECSRGLAACDQLATCSNTGGSYECTCGEGVGTGFYCHEDKCTASECGAGTCQHTPTGFNCACPVGTGGTRCEVDCSGVLSFAPALEGAIREQLGRPSGDLMVSHFAEHSVLLADNVGIDELSGLECWTNLRTLSLKNNQVTDLKPLAGLTQLSDLDLSCNPVSDFSALAGLQALSSLTLDSDGTCASVVSQATGELALLQGLETLTLNRREIPSLKELSELPQLKSLTVTGANLKDLGELSSASAIETLVLSRNAIEDLTGLERLPRLRILELDDNPVSDLGPLEASFHLQELRVNHATVSDVAPIVALPELRVLLLRDNQLETVEVLAQLVQIYSLDIGENAISAISPFAANPQYGFQGELNFEGNRISCQELVAVRRALVARGLQVTAGTDCL